MSEVQEVVSFTEGYLYRDQVITARIQVFSWAEKFPKEESSSLLIWVYFPEQDKGYGVFTTKYTDLTNSLPSSTLPTVSFQYHTSALSSTQHPQHPLLQSLWTARDLGKTVVAWSHSVGKGSKYVTAPFKDFPKSYFQDYLYPFFQEYMMPLIFEPTA